MHVGKRSALTTTIAPQTNKGGKFLIAVRWSESRNCGLCVAYIYRKMELRYWLVPGNVKNNRIN